MNKTLTKYFGKTSVKVQDLCNKKAISIANKNR